MTWVLKSSTQGTNDMRHHHDSSTPFINGFGLLTALLVSALLIGDAVMAGGYVDATQTLDPAGVTNAGTVIQRYNNAQFNNKILVGLVHNNPIQTPSTADPVSTVSGNNYHDETDFQIRGRNGLNYVFTRTYNSASSATGVDRGLGPGWVHSYGMQLVSNDFGNCPNCTSAQAAENGNGKTASITYTDERGGQQNFLVNETSFAVTKPLGDFDTLTLDSPVAGQHTLTFRNGVKYTFETPSGVLKTTPNVKARLKTISNPWGDQLNLAYDGIGRLSAITDNLGIATRTGLVFNYISSSDTHIKSVTDWAGRQWNFTYLGTDLWLVNNPLTINTPLTPRRQYHYIAGHLLDYFFKPLTRNNLPVVTFFNYYENGRVFDYFDGMGNTETLDYDLYRKNTRVTDARGGVREYSYDANGLMTKLIEPDGGVLTFASQSDGLRNSKYDALGYQTQYSYRLDKAFAGASDTGGNVSREQDALSQTIDTTYGPYDQVASVKDKRGNTITTSFYSTTSGCALNGKPQAVTLSTLNGSSNVKIRDYCWNSNGTLNSQTEYLDAAGSHKRTTTYTYDPASNGLNVSDVNVTATNTTAVIHTQFTYDSLGRTKTSTLNRTTSPTNSALEALTTSYTYDALDRAIQVKNPAGRVQETVYDLNDQVYQEKTWYPSTTARSGCAAPTTINGVSYAVCTEATHQYDTVDRRISTTDILGKISKFDYDPAGNLARQIDANGNITKYEYDAMNRRTAMIDANGRRTVTGYNQRGDVTSITNPNGETVKSQYDELGRLKQLTDNLGYITQYQYDANGNQTCVIDANEHSLTTDPSYQPINSNGCTFYNSYDELNRLISSKDAQGNITAYSYDLLGNRTQVTDANNHSTLFKYDDLGRLSEIDDPLTHVQTFINDEAGNVIQITDRKGQISQHVYDVLNRKTQSTYLADGTQDNYTYDNFDDLAQVQNDAVSYTYVYDNKHRMQSKTDSRQSKSLSWTFDPVDNIKTKTDYQGNITTYQYDDSNRLTAEANPNYLEVSYHYDPAGRLLDRLLSNGAQTHYSYDSGGRLIRLTNQSATGLLVNDTQYSRDHLGNILTATESTGTQQTSGTTTFKYDPEYRLKSATYPVTANNETITYDPVGNRKTYTKGSLTLYYNVNNANRLIDTRTGSATGTLYESYGYDNNGSMTSISGNRTVGMTWNAHNRISQMQINSIPAYSYQYDPSGYRIQKIAGSTKNYYLQAEHLEAIYDNSGNILGQFFRGSVIDEVVNAYQQDNAGKLVNYTFHHDALESVLGQSGHDGTILASQGYTSFGSTINATGSSNNLLKFTGREQDTETGYYYLRARYYDPILGRFPSEDPVGFAGGINLYTYAGNNPINANDPTGNAPLGEVLTSIASKFGIGDCKDCANALMKATVDSGNSGTLLEMRANIVDGKGEYIWNDAVNKNISTNADHAAVEVNGLVYDNINPKGIPRAEWEAQFDSMFGLKPIQETPFGPGLPSITLNELGSTLIAGSVIAVKVVDIASQILDPVGTYIFGKEAGSNSDIVPNISPSSYIGWSSNATNAWYQMTADGGFVIYPNKSNTNIMRSIYSKGR
ncbi:RHS repeat-associated core domain-containing protein (plasmid) [Methylomonas sp. 2BW1-5-20]|uniref:RHS repeat-associated core domain-containing protein n=1 Tax=Methylomonas sp. 2BW1-5-20 TaxID=3376686 RepID=UPI0040515014